MSTSSSSGVGSATAKTQATERSFTGLQAVELSPSGTDPTSLEAGSDPGRKDEDQEQPQREAWIENPNDAYFGLALSGGGIRSATFNLGVLQGLNERGYLTGLHYLATVSGGGYVGGFWTLWRTLNPGAAVFPDASANPAIGAENAPIRHLRKFSRFLAPSLGAFSFDTGRMLVALINAVVPSLVGAAGWVSLMLLASVAIGALVLVTPVLPLPAWLDGPLAFRHSAPAVTSGVAAFLWGSAHLLAMRAMWRRRSSTSPAALTPAALQEQGPRANPGNSTPRPVPDVGHKRVPKRDGPWVRRTTYVAASVLMGMVWGWWIHTHPDLPQRALDAFLEIQHLHVSNWSPSTIVWTYVMAPAWLLLVVASVMTIGVMLGSAIARQFRRHDVDRVGPIRQATDRVSSWMMFAAAAWAVLVLLWWIAFFVAANHGTAGTALRSLSIAGIPLATLIPWLQRFTGGRSTSGERTGERAARWSLIGISYVVVAALVVLLMWAIIAVHRHDVWGWFAAGVAVALVVALAYDPNHVGLHHFYRQRIARGFLGAAHAEGNAIDSDTEPQDKDDISMAKLRPDGPCHLVVCAANDLTPADALDSLGRGARSAVLSHAGYSIGSQSVSWNEARIGVPTLAAALTASGAAFNTQMGAKSKTLGPAVSFIMSAFGLRLGLWVRNPSQVDGKTRVVRSGFGGFALLAELLGMSDARNGTYVFLSDGGHFDNTGLYELVRRHCRYVIVSDCGQDTGRNFDDLGTVVRLVREDFNVDIKIDLDPLRPDENGVSRQPMVAGDIHYPNGDTGTLLVLKPTITGAEPPDVLQYRSRNPIFPHQSTGDQFFDEAQWESYRRLGQHIARTAFAAESARHPTLTNSSPSLTGTHTAPSHPLGQLRRKMSRDFGRARREWQPRAVDYAERVDRLTRLVGSLEVMLQQTRGRLMREVMWEIMPGVAGERDRADDNRLSDDLAAVRQALVTFESIFLSENLGAQFNQPIYTGVMNVMARWMRTSLVRTWWPLLSSTCGGAFRQFVKAQFEVPQGRRSISAEWDEARLEGVLDLATRHRELPVGPGRAWDGSSATLAQMHLILTLEDASASRGGPKLPKQRVEVARLDLVRSAAAVTGRAPTDSHLLMWHAGDLFVPPGLWGLGFGGDVLRQLAPTLDDGRDADKSAETRTEQQADARAQGDVNTSAAGMQDASASPNLSRSPDCRDHQLVFVQTFRSGTPELKKDSADLQQLYLDAGFSPDIPAKYHQAIANLYPAFHQVCSGHAAFLPQPDGLWPPQQPRSLQREEAGRLVMRLQHDERFVMLFRAGVGSREGAR